MTGLDMQEAVEAGARAICMATDPWPCLSSGVHRAAATRAILAALPHILEPFAAEFAAEADDKDREGNENADMDDDWRAHRAWGSRDAYRSAAKRVRGMGK